MGRYPRRPGFSLFELLIVVALMGIVAGIVIPSASGTVHDQLQAAAQVVSAELAYARSMAVMNNSNYKLTFNRTNNQLVLQHSGTSAALNTLPPSPYRSPNDPPHQQITDLDDLPQMGMPVSLIEVQATSSNPARVSDVEFGPLGQATRPEDTTIWLGAGAAADRRYISVRVNRVTGLADIGSFEAAPPPAATGVALP